MSEDEKDDGKGFTFIKEEILPKRKSRLKRICLSLGFTVVLALIFGIIARAAFIISEPFMNRLFGIDANKKTVVIDKEKDAKVSITPTKAPMVTITVTPTATPTPKKKNDKILNTTNNKYDSEKDKDQYSKEWIAMNQEMFEIAQKASTSIVTVIRTKESTDVLGSTYDAEKEIPGLIVGDNGVEYLILVPYSETKDTKRLRVLFHGKEEVEAEKVAQDKETNLAILSVKLSDLSKDTKTNTEIAKLGESYGLQQGAPVIAIGAPNGVMNSIDYGIITNTNIVRYICDMKLELISTSMIACESGIGYIINMNGEIIGIISNSFHEDINKNICLSMGISKLKPLIEKMVNGNPRAYIGLVTEDLSNQALKEVELDYGIYVADVLEKSPAYEAGIQVGDIIVTINDTSVRGVTNYVNILNELKNKEDVKIKIVRLAGKSPKAINISVTIGKRK